MYTKEDLKAYLRDMGLKHTDAVMVHSSMKSIGEVEGRADTVVDAFMEYFGEGMFMTPVHTWAQMSEQYNIFDPVNEDGCVGIIPNIFYKREGVFRSLHPTHSIAAYGRGAKEYVKGEEDVTTPCAPGGCWDRLRTIDAKILLVGVNHVKNTYIHAVEEALNVPERLTEQPVQMKIVMPDGSMKNVAMHRHYNRHTAHISESFEKLSKAFTECGAARPVKFGAADSILCDTRKVYEVVSRVLAHDINCIIERESIPREWWME